MTTTYSLTMKARCPVDPSIIDTYRLEIVFDGMLRVEAILEVVAELTREPVYQEHLTEALAKRLDARVWTWGEHSEVETQCFCS